MTVKPRIKLLAIAVVAVFASLALLAFYSVAGPVSNERYAVYSAYLEHQRVEFYPDLGDGRLSFSILNHTIDIPAESSSWTKESKLIQQEMALRCRFRRKLNRQFVLSGGYSLVAESDFLATPFAKLPLGLESFSDVVFEDHGTLAHFYYEHTYCPLCGEGTFVTMRKVGTGWVVSHEDGTWVS